MNKLIPIFIMSAFLLTGCNNGNKSEQTDSPSETVTEAAVITTTEQNITVSEEKETTETTSATVATTTAKAASDAQNDATNTNANTTSKTQDDALFFEETDKSPVQEQATQEITSEPSENDVVELPIIPLN